MKQEWCCMQCATCRSVSVRSHSGVWSVINLIERSHQKSSPECHAAFGYNRIRVRTSDCTKREWENILLKAGSLDKFRKGGRSRIKEVGKHGKG